MAHPAIQKSPWAPPSLRKPGSSLCSGQAREARLAPVLPNPDQPLWQAQVCADGLSHPGAGPPRGRALGPARFQLLRGRVMGDGCQGMAGDGGGGSKWETGAGCECKRWAWEVSGVGVEEGGQ